MALQLYQLSDFEKAELQRLEALYKYNTQSATFWDAATGLIYGYVTTNDMQNATTPQQQANGLDAFQATNDWFKWRDWFNGQIQYKGVTQVVNGNSAFSGWINLESYVLYAADLKNKFVDAAKKAKAEYTAFQIILDDKNKALVDLNSEAIAAQEATAAAEANVELAQIQAETKKFLVDNYPYLIVGAILFLIIAFYLYKKFIKKK